MLNFNLIRDMDTNKKNFEIYHEYIVSINDKNGSIAFIKSILNKYVKEGKLFELLEIVYLINTCIEKYNISNLSEFHDIIEEIYKYHKNIKVKILYLTSCLDNSLFDKCNEILNECKNKEEKNYLNCILSLHKDNYEEALSIYNEIKDKEKYPNLFSHIVSNIEISSETITKINRLIFSLIKQNKYEPFVTQIEKYFSKIINGEYVTVETLISKIVKFSPNLEFIVDFVIHLIRIDQLKLAKNIIDSLRVVHKTAKIIPKLENELSQKIGVSLVVACMNREENLIQALPSWFDVPYIKEFIIVDYSSKNPLEENKDIIKWKQKYNIKLITVEGESTFNLGKAYNLAFDIAKENYILKIDSDYKLIDPDFFDQLLLNNNIKNYFVRADFRFSSSMSGFFFIHRNNLLHFREDLNGYGFDEIDLYNRIKNNIAIQEIIWFNIEKSIYHIPHNNIKRGVNYLEKDIFKTEHNNRYLCMAHSPMYPSRKMYTVNNNHVSFNTTSLDSIVCINLENRTDRWNLVKSIPNVERFDAILTTEKNFNDVLNEHNMSFDPVNLTSKIYFGQNKGAYGAYLSHYSVWEHIVNNNIPYTLILEDDIDIESVQSLLKSNVIFENHELIQLSMRIHWYENRMIFNGGESYILSLSGAKKLISATNCPTLLNYVKPAEEDYIIQYYMSKELYGIKYSWGAKRSITCPVDKFMGYCCENNANDFIRIKHYFYPCIKLNEDTSKLSSIITKNNNTLSDIEKYL